MIYFDKFDNRLDIYGNGDTGWKNYIAGTPSSGHSDYDDYTLGANLEGGYAINTWNKIKAGFQFRQTSHKVVDDGKETSKLLENIWSIDAEYSVNPFKAFTAVAGLGLDAFTPQDYWKDGNGYSTVGVFNPAYFDNKSDSQFLPTFQLGLFYDLTESHELHLTYARKNRFPTPFERYSSRFGTTVPNPNLGPEYADHFEFGYKGYFLEKISITSALYLSNVTNKIATTQVPDPDGSTTPKSKSENLDKAFIYGFEFGTEVYLNQFFSVGGSLGVNKYNITESKAGLKYLGYSPELTANGYLVIKPFENFNLKPVSNIKLIPRFEYVGSRYISSSATKPAILESYTLVHLKAAADITDNVSFSFAINNLFDELYEIRQYFPQAGLSVNLTLEGRY
jgi:iron complex outermembrane receptor protein